MKTVAVALVLLGFFAGCASNQSPSASVAASTDRPDLHYKSQSACEKAGRTWIATSGVCL
jgi:PBP1b-binding outer membrane lipoprotein LpoB